jgi:hypothetical protein
VDVFGTAVLVALFVGVPLWVIADVALDAYDKRRGVDKTRYSFWKYVCAIVVLLFLSAASITL